MGVAHYVFKSLDVSSNILLQSPPLSPPLSTTDVTIVCNGVNQQEFTEDVEISNKIKETEVCLSFKKTTSPTTLREG